MQNGTSKGLKTLSVFMAPQAVRAFLETQSTVALKDLRGE